MKRSLLLLSLTIAVLFADDIIWQESFEVAKERAVKENRPIMLMYTMQECQACWYMKNIVFIDAEVFTYINSNFISVEVDIDDERIEDFKPVGTPTFFFLRPSGSVLEKVAGTANRMVFKEKLESIVKRWNTQKKE